MVPNTRETSPVKVPVQGAGILGVERLLEAQFNVVWPAEEEGALCGERSAVDQRWSVGPLPSSHKQEAK